MTSLTNRLGLRAHKLTKNLGIAIVALGIAKAENNPEELKYKELSVEALYSGFKTPPAEAKTFVRWWWSSNRIEPEQIERELDVLHKAGIGGVEINPIQGREGRGFKSEVKPLRWRSKQWDRMVQHAGREAKKRGMIADLLPGSGWPFGGDFLKPDQLIMRTTTVDRVVEGPRKASFDWDELEKEMRDNVKHGHKGEVSLQRVKLYPAGMKSLDQVVDVTDQVKTDGEFTIEVPEGRHILSFRMFQTGYRFVTGGVDGAKGSSMDHYRKEITELYLNRLKGVEETWKEPLSTYIRAIFCDSIETAGANWTHGILDDFKARMGYDVEPYFPFVLLKTKEVKGKLSPEFNDTVRRVRYDWSRFISTYFHENFTKVLHQFCRDNGLLSRYQAYGTPYLMDMAEGYMIPDIPESNNWLRLDPWFKDHYTADKTRGYMVWSKYASAGARLRNQRIVSIEAMTTTENTFKRTLGDLKQADDMNFIAGMTHTVLHGFNSVPKDVPFPGMIRFGTFFSHWNTWWPYIDRWFAYNSRLSYVMQNTHPTAEIALIGPSADVWSDDLLNRGAFHFRPWYVHRLWESFSQLGSDSDYLHEKVLQNAKIEKGRLKIGMLDAEVLFVVQATSMHPETVEAMQRFAESGGKLIFVGDPPSRSPGFLEIEGKEKRISEAVQKCLAAGAIQLKAPRRDAKLREWAAAALQAAKFEGKMKISSPRDGLFSLRKTSGQDQVIFITNTYQKESLKTQVEIDLGEKGLWRWDPETGESSPYDFPYDDKGIEVELQALESLLLVTGPKKEPAKARTLSKGEVEAKVLEGPWEVIFHPAEEEETFTMTFPALKDFSQSEEEQIRKFSGMAVYRASFEVEDLNYLSLDLGWDNAFITDVSLNGQDLGVSWYGLKLFDLKSSLKKGKNDLVIKYTTTLNNKMNEELLPSGLIGPVRLSKGE